MSTPRYEFTPVRPRSGGRVHATSLADPSRTACNRKCEGWRVETCGRKRIVWKVVLQALSCIKCKAIIFMPVKRKREADLS